MYTDRYSKFRNIETIKKVNTWSTGDLNLKETKKIRMAETFDEGKRNGDDLEEKGSRKFEDIIEQGHFVHEPIALKSQPHPTELLIMMWNVNSLNSKLDRPEFLNYLKSKPFDIICYNETKYSDKKFKQLKMESHPLWHEKFHQYWHFSTKKLGYSGVCILSKLKPLSYQFGLKNRVFDSEGRIITLEYESFYLICVYAPCSGIRLERLDERMSDWERPLHDHLINLKKKKDVMLVGDLNVAHTELDVANKARAQNFPGFTDEERTAFGDLLKNGFKDSFREKYPTKIAYSWWDARTYARKRNDGWRLDYCVINESAYNNVVDVELRTDVDGSDHCPLEVRYKYKNEIVKEIKENESKEMTDASEIKEIIEITEIKEITSESLTVGDSKEVN
jgi:exodeoxyribonuclease-3